jgi:hypothetical protein
MLGRSSLWLPFLMLLCLLICRTHIWIANPGKGITKANSEKIKEGMTLKEVQRILGVVPGDYSNLEPGRRIFFFWGGVLWYDNVDVKTWLSDEGMIEVGFGSNQTVKRWRFKPTSRAHETTLAERLAGYLGFY